MTDTKSAQAGVSVLAIIFLALACPALNAQSESTNSIAGTWQYENPAAPGAVSFETFTSDGGSLGIDNLPGGGNLANMAIGTWTRLGPREFLATMHKQIWKLVQNQGGEFVFEFNGSIKIRRHITLSADGNELTGVHKVEVFDAAGNVELDFPPGPFSGTRIFAEPLPGPARMLTPQISGGDVTVRLTGEPGVSHELQRSSRVDGNWQKLADLVVPANGPAEFTDPAPPQPNGYYRAVGP